MVVGFVLLLMLVTLPGPGRPQSSIEYAVTVVLSPVSLMFAWGLQFLIMGRGTGSFFFNDEEIEGNPVERSAANSSRDCEPPARASQPSAIQGDVHATSAHVDPLLGADELYALPPDSTSCPCCVCGDVLTVPVVVCRTCESIVHARCRRYAGRCPRYGCASRPTGHLIAVSRQADKVDQGDR